MNNVIDIKHQILEEIRNNVDVFTKRNGPNWSIRCPICGDSQTDLRDSHCYIKCSDDPNEPLYFNCFKCNAGGRITGWFLKKLNIKPEVIAMLDTGRYTKLISSNQSLLNIATDKPIMNSPQVKYIESRLGPGLEYEDYQKFKIIWDTKDVLEYITNPRVRNTFPSNDSTISFLSDNQAVVINRTFLGDQTESQWRKITIVNKDTKAFYTIKTQIDLFSLDKTVVNIAEGIFDILSVYKNFNDCDNSAFIATLGSDYISAVNYAIAKGLIGTNVELRLYIDNGIKEKQLKYTLRRFKWMFNSIKIFHNIKSKDVGVPIDQIKLSWYKI